MLIHSPRLLPPAISTHKPVPAPSIFLQRFPLSASERPRPPLFKFCSARRRVRYEEDDNGGEEEGEEYDDNAEIAMLESYTESARSEVLLVRAMGYSSCLSSRTATDPSKSVLPAKAIIQWIDVIKGSFDPYRIEHLDKGLTFEEFKVRLQGS